MAHLSVKSVVVNDLHPRTLPHLHPKTARYHTLDPRHSLQPKQHRSQLYSLRTLALHCLICPGSPLDMCIRLQVQRRELWLTLHGEAHFRSLHSTNFSEEASRPQSTPTHPVHLSTHTRLSKPLDPPTAPVPITTTPVLLLTPSPSSLFHRRLTRRATSCSRCSRPCPTLPPPPPTTATCPHRPPPLRRHVASASKTWWWCGSHGCWSQGTRSQCGPTRAPTSSTSRACRCAPLSLFPDPFSR